MYIKMCGGHIKSHFSLHSISTFTLKWIVQPDQSPYHTTVPKHTQTQKKIYYITYSVCVCVYTVNCLNYLPHSVSLIHVISVLRVQTLTLSLSFFVHSLYWFYSFTALLLCMYLFIFLFVIVAILNVNSIFFFKNSFPFLLLLLLKLYFRLMDLIHLFANTKKVYFVLTLTMWENNFCFEI